MNVGAREKKYSKFVYILLQLYEIIKNKKSILIKKGTSIL